MVREIKKRIGLIIEEYCKNQTDFANKIGISKQKVSYIMNNEDYNPSIAFIHKISTTFKDINLEWLISGRGEMVKINPSNERQIYKSGLIGS